MFAVVEIAGRQYTVNPNDTIIVPNLHEQAGTTLRFDRVLLVGDGAAVTVGTPHLSGAHVEGKILEHGKRDTVIVFKKKRRKGYRVRRGHRQPQTRVEITKIVQ